MLKNLVVAAVAALALTGCGNLCDRAASSWDNFEPKIKPCLQAGTTFDAFNTNQCNQAQDDCNEAERKALQDFYDCVDDMPYCAPNDPGPFNRQAAVCNDKLAPVGDSCAAAFF